MNKKGQGILGLGLALLIPVAFGVMVLFDIPGMFGYTRFDLGITGLLRGGMASFWWIVAKLVGVVSIVLPVWAFINTIREGSY